MAWRARDQVSERPSPEGLYRCDESLDTYRSSMARFGESSEGLRLEETRRPTRAD
jgi:hypothetical protein